MADQKHRAPRQSRHSRHVGRKLGQAFDQTVGRTLSTVGHAVHSTLRLTGLAHRRQHADPPAHLKPGGVPGLEAFADRNSPPPAGTVHLTVHDYGPGHLAVTQPDDLPALLAEPRPAGVAVRWINVDGLHPWVVKQFVEAFGFHTLAAEDTLHVPQRPKAEAYDDHLFIVARMIRLHEQTLSAEQVSMFLKDGLLVTFQEYADDVRRGDVWGPVRKRLETADSRIRRSGADYLAYALLDAVVDHCFPVLERFGDMLEELEPRVIEDPSPPLIAHIHGIKRELALLRRVLWPTRELVSTMMSENTAGVGDETKLFLRDVQEHCIQLVEIIETFRDMTSSLTDLHMSAVGNRMNEVMKFLTIMGTIFIPITFLAGIYGMNFEHIPELGLKNGYYYFWGITGAITLALIGWFYRKGWIGRG
jgi:magnesium transporter